MIRRMRPTPMPRQWSATVARLLTPLYQLIIAEIIAGRVVETDVTDLLTLNTW